ncbi:receptor-type tyrosine-protein phosphatase N2 [Eupeodes corollae]|uniref:receptor-type tyrosine-protein phosphatase N2 n=1 Tax=Eupeodes corollae TaxID=290404 RepID=UPI0024914476|nr:receptor-type tyrosine-protein phosphatase N2 [Eupeodes corollae]XP_055921434.1 receptor-type tyrosine-protein phosphatase N2 [Eupeodes corollae]XP_055921435.1 receptor-type tyrosine-protein phosphatase N2 [Eupeodes corollae]
MARNVQNNGRTWNRCNWDVTPLKLITVAFLLSQGYVANGEGNVGCHFVKTLCLEGAEVCYDDNIFGKCLPTTGVEPEDIDKQPLTEEQSRILATMLEEMQGAGLGWDHPFVQCRIQGALFSLQRDTPLPPNLCANLAPDPEILGGQGQMAFVRFAPPSEDYAEEVFFPPPKKQSYFEPNANRNHRLRAPGFEYSNSPKELEYLRPKQSPMDLEMERERERILLEDQRRKEVVDRLRALQTEIQLKNLLAGSAPKANYPNDELVYLGPPSAAGNDPSSVPGSYFRENFGPVRENWPVEESRMPFKRMDTLSRDDEVMLNTNIYPVQQPKKAEGVYTEGGLVFMPDRNRFDMSHLGKEKARELLANMLGFTRHERLDVKKPGPIVGPPPSVHSATEKPSGKESKTTDKAENKEVLPEHIKGEGTTKKKKVVKDHSDEDHAPHSVDTEYAHVFVKNPVDSWSDGVRIVNELANILHMRGFFNYLTVHPHEVSFRVDSNNPEKKNATDIARAINDARVKNNILRRLGVTVVRAGVGDKIKADEDGSVSSSRIEIAEEGPDVTHIMAYMFAGAGAAAVIVIFVTLILIRRHDKKRDKLGGLQSGISGAESCSKDYQDLCRSRMSGKGNTAEPAASGRITSLAKENDRPPSSRSSTSSWSEEPALTNMDISTGHMVLSYMEDHLRNKGRLQREWEALCRYEAEPSARDAALQPQCATLNRNGAPLPFDHSRVVLNHLANAEGLDYINASTITDHDPRAPAYVAAQGPLPTTLAHFWQMIWEQGAVVIVSLCRLQENGEVACARYWPEEGAEVYHIYEVHLVSEHIWCDDYLVRSFYLKNLRTSETRTVTQFHFLSWPQGGVPASAKALLDFRRKVNKSYRGRSCPIVVHGSAGAGRTGAYILLDLVLGRMNKGAREIDIAATLEHLRDQRAGLVATRQQFEFVLMAVAEEVHAILKALPANQGEKRELDKEQQSLKEEEPDAVDESTENDELIKKEKEPTPEKTKKSDDKK